MVKDARMKWCCRWFRDAVSNAGHRGMGIFVDDSHGAGTRFVMQFRAMEPDAEPPTYTADRLSLVTEHPLQFCPWCGRAVKRFYRRNLAALTRPDLSITIEGFE